MATIIISKIKVRRGTDSERRTVVLDQGELGYTTDTNRLYVGNGSSAGGLAIGSKVHAPLDSEAALGGLIAEVGDVVWVRNTPYQLISPNPSDPYAWKKLETLVNSDYFEYDIDNQITLKENSVKLENLKDNLVDEITLKVDDRTVELFSNKIIRIKELGINKEHLNSYAVTKDKLAPNVVGNGLEGAAGEPLSIKIDTDNFYFKDNMSLAINLSSVAGYGDNITTVKNLSGGISVKEKSINETHLLSSSFGNGLSGGNGNKVTIVADPIMFGFADSKFKLNTNTIDETFIKEGTFGKGLAGGNGIKPTLNIDPNYFGYDALSALTLLPDTINHTHIKKESFGPGLSGGEGELISLKLQDNLFTFEVGKLGLSANSITEKYINSNSFENGIQGGNSNKISIKATNNFTFTSAYELDLNVKITGSDTATISSINKTDILSLSSGISFPSITWDDFGRITNIKTSIVEVLTGRSDLGNSNISNSLSSIFNGSITQGSQSLENITKFTAIDNNNNTITLSSAGFLAFSSENTSLSGQQLKRFAIPIFAY